MVSCNSERGRRLFAEKLRKVTESCTDCGFADAILGGAWRTTVTTHDRNGTAVYRLRCPDCGRVRDVELRLP